MSVLGFRNFDHLPSVWAEARSGITIHNEARNVNQVINRIEAANLSHSTTLGPIRNVSSEVPQEGIYRQSASYTHFSPYNYIGDNYNIHGQSTYTPNVNPVIIDRVV